MDSNPIRVQKNPYMGGCWYCVQEKIQQYQEKEIALGTSQYLLTELRSIKKGKSRVYACARHYREEMGL